jgi:hypothetical protein
VVFDSPMNGHTNRPPSSQPGEPRPLQTRLEQFRDWRTAVTDELRRLPETLSQFRTGVINFSLVSEHMTVEAVTTELQRLPDTLTQLREGVANFNAVAERLSIATEALERFARHAEATGFVDVARRVDDAVGLVTRQFASARETAPASFELVQSSINELTRTVGRLGDLIPPRSRSRPSEPPDKKATRSSGAAKKSTKSTKKSR